MTTTTTTSQGAAFDTIEFFKALQAEMNAAPDRFRIIGDADTAFAVVMRDGNRTFAVRVRFEELACPEVGPAAPGGDVDFTLVGPLHAWRAMFDDIVANGRATGLHTINSLVLLGDDVHLVGDDPMGLDKFSRFNQTLQEFFDGAARVVARA
jgi:hypothetical protein